MPARRARPSPSPLAIHALTPERWPDLLRLFGPRGACAGCWCMWWRLRRKEFDAGIGGRNRRRLQSYVEAGHVPGLLAYDGVEPVGWVAVEPREAYPTLERSRTLARVDEQPVWSVTCFFVARSHRRRGVTRALIEAAVRHAREGGGRIVEAYPVVPRAGLADAQVYTGAASTFLSLGFEEVARRSPRRAVVRKAVGRRGTRPRGRAGEEARRRTAGGAGAAGRSQRRPPVAPPRS